MKQKSLCAHVGKATLRAAASDRIEFGGNTYVPDSDSAYFEFSCAHSFPVVTTDGCALHPSVVAASHGTMRHKVINLGHMMASYGTSAEDRTLGTVVAVGYPEMPEGGWVVPGSIEAAPGLSGVGLLHRACRGVPMILEQQHSGDVSWAVSMEISYWLGDSAIMVRNDFCGRFGVAQGVGPDDIVAAGWSVFEYESAPPMLRAAVHLNGGMAAVAPEYMPGVVLLTGGLRGRVNFNGLALTYIGKEPTARTRKFTASLGEPKDLKAVIPYLVRIGQILGDVARK